MPASPWVREVDLSPLPFPPPSAERLLLLFLALGIVVMLARMLQARRRGKGIGGRGALESFLLALLFLCAGEAALRWHLARLQAGPYLTDSRLQWRLRAGLRNEPMPSPGGMIPISTNSLGLRDREISEKKPGELRILCLGDSWTFGHGVREPECFVRQLEGRLRRGPPARNVSVINGGQHGYSIIQAYALFEDLLPICQPDVVILCGFNEFSGDRVAERILVKPPEGLVGKAIALFSQSMLYLTVKKLVFTARYSSRPHGEDADSKDSPRGGPPRFVSLDQTRAMYEQFEETCSSRGIRLVIFDHASAFSGNGGRPRHPVLSDLPTPAGTWVMAVQPPSLLRNDPAFWVSMERTHPSPAGHREMAECLARFLVEQQCLEPMRP